MGSNTLPTLSGWGRLQVPGQEIFSEDLEKITEGASLSRGLGRSYGDSSLPTASHPIAVNTTLADRLLAFDEASGLLRAEAGLSLYELNRLFLKRLWMTPVTPGTQFVTLGGMVASDVHGKSHHIDGTFGQHVRRLKMRLATGEVLWCGPDQHPDLFWATVGGMGLTGHVLEVEFALRRIPSQWIYQESFRLPNLDAMLEGLKGAADQWPMTMAWMDCITTGKHMGRGVLFAGRWATEEEAGGKPGKPQPFHITVPFELPSWLLNPLTMKIFNSLVYHSHYKKVAKGLVDPWKFFYPLDTIRYFNRCYGRKGFTQHQAVIPAEAGPNAVREFLKLVVSRGANVFLCVLKDCGPQGDGLLSFPKRGMSLAMDLPVRDNTQSLIDELNARVIDLGGRIYLTKDSFTRPEHFQAMEPRLGRFLEVRRKYDPQRRLRSVQSVRLLGDKP